MNERFANHVQSTAFQLSLSRKMIAAFATLHAAIEDDIEVLGWPIDDIGLNGLERRGLVVHHMVPDKIVDGRRRADLHLKWGDIKEITRAGGLVLELLKEAGLYHPRRAAKMLPTLPPPDPHRPVVSV